MLNKQSVLRCLRHGKDNAITGDRLAKLLGERNDRHVRLLIRDLIEEGYPIASSVHPPCGYYLIENISEYEEYTAVLRSRAIDNFIRLRDFRRAAGRLFNGRQIAMGI